MITPLSTLISTVTADPHSGDLFVADASGSDNRSRWIGSAAILRILPEYNLIRSVSGDMLFSFLFITNK